MNTLFCDWHICWSVFWIFKYENNTYKLNNILNSNLCSYSIPTSFVRFFICLEWTCLDPYVGVILQMQVMFITILHVSLLWTCFLLLLLLAVAVVSYFYVVRVGTAYMYATCFFLCGTFFLIIWYKVYIYTVFIYTIHCGCWCICAMLMWLITVYACITCRSMKSTVTNMSRTRMKWSNM